MGQTLYHNGTILTMEDQKPWVGAVLTENGYRQQIYREM